MINANSSFSLSGNRSSLLFFFSIEYESFSDLRIDSSFLLWIYSILPHQASFLISGTVFSFEPYQTVG